MEYTINAPNIKMNINITNMSGHTKIKGFKNKDFKPFHWFLIILKILIIASLLKHHIGQDEWISTKLRNDGDQTVLSNNQRDLLHFLVLPYPFQIDGIYDSTKHHPLHRRFLFEQFKKDVLVIDWNCMCPRSGESVDNLLWKLWSHPLWSLSPPNILRRKGSIACGYMAK